MNAANDYLLRIGKLAPDSYLTAGECQTLSGLLDDDAQDYYYSAIVTLVDGLRSIPAGFYSWATVKFYYAVFYALRARLAMAGECIAYDVSSPRHATTTLGYRVRRLKGTTHKCVLDQFKSSFPRDFFLSQEIDTLDPLTWLADKREEVNYREPRFSEPSIPQYFQFARRTELRGMLSSYEADDVYIHDPDHAMVAFPFRLVRDLRLRLKSRGIQPLRTPESEFLMKSTKDRAGYVSAIAALIS